MTEEAITINGPNGRLACRRAAGRGPGVFWLGGFASDMTGTKAAFLADWAAQTGRAFARFDYSGHGASAGRFAHGTIGAWASDARAVFDALTDGPQILVGSSMGGWIAALLALARPERTAAMVLVAPAPDFTEELVWKTLSDEDRARLSRDGRIEEPSPYGGTSVITQRLIEEGREHLLLGGEIGIACPVRILHGMNDVDVPYTHALRFAELLRSDDVEIVLIKSGDHRLSSPGDLARLVKTLGALA